MRSELHNYQNNMSSSRHTPKSKEPIAAVSAADFPKTSPPKPMRPLTAYHIFFQIEREYIIQTTPGANADSSIHNHKSYQANVPRRYVNIKLSNDWYAGPGKRAKRKHRKSHGKIGFLELSRVVSQRWANLGEIDPETKAFVTGIAQRELDEYKKEMKEYEALVGSTNGGVEPVAPVSKVTKTTTVKKPKRSAKKPLADVAAEVMPSTTFKRSGTSGTIVTPPCSPPPSDFLSADFDINSVFVDVLPDAAFSTESITFEDNVDYSISFIDNAGHHIPSPASSVCEERKRSFSDDSICDPLFELEMPSNYDSSPKRRKISNDGIGRTMFDDSMWV
jgi:hypothetical protein